MSLSQNAHAYCGGPCLAGCTPAFWQPDKAERQRVQPLGSERRSATLFLCQEWHARVTGRYAHCLSLSRLSDGRHRCGRCVSARAADDAISSAGALVFFQIVAATGSLAAGPPTLRQIPARLARTRRHSAARQDRRSLFDDNELSVLPHHHGPVGASCIDRRGGDDRCRNLRRHASIAAQGLNEPPNGAAPGAAHRRYDPPADAPPRRPRHRPGQWSRH